MDVILAGDEALRVTQLSWDVCSCVGDGGESSFDRCLEAIRHTSVADETGVYIGIMIKVVYTEV